MKYEVQEHLKPRGHPVLVLDVFEPPRGRPSRPGEKDKYVKAFLENVSWEVVDQRFKDSVRRMAPARG
jgi:superoxide dismutase